MDVLFVPDYTRGNPHQLQLDQALAPLGVRATLSGGIGRLPLLGAVAAHGRPDVLHLHWTDRMLLGRSRAASALRSAAFIGQVISLRRAGVRVVWTVHNLHSHSGHHQRIEHAANRILARLYDGIIVYCCAAASAVRRQFALPSGTERKITISALGHYLGVYPDNVTRVEARRHLGYGD